MWENWICIEGYGSNIYTIHTTYRVDICTLKSRKKLVVKILILAKVMDKWIFKKSRLQFYFVHNFGCDQYFFLGFSLSKTIHLTPQMLKSDKKKIWPYKGGLGSLDESVNHVWPKIFNFFLFLHWKMNQKSLCGNWYS